jgi:hypothetical protein
MAEGYQAERFLTSVERMGTPDQIERRTIATDELLAEFPRLEAKIDVLLAKQQAGVAEWKFWVGIFFAMLLPAVSGYGVVVRMDQRLVNVEAATVDLKTSAEDYQTIVDQRVAPVAARIREIETRMDAARDRRDAQLETVKQQVAGVDKQTVSLVGDVSAIRAIVERLERRDGEEGRKP